MHASERCGGLGRLPPHHPFQRRPGRISGRGDVRPRWRVVPEPETGDGPGGALPRSCAVPRKVMLRAGPTHLERLLLLLLLRAVVRAPDVSSGGSGAGREVRGVGSHQLRILRWWRRACHRRRVRSHVNHQIMVLQAGPRAAQPRLRAQSKQCIVKQR